jgi:hypothetical protein
MDGRSPRAIMYVNTGVSDPALAAEYHRWYVDVHFGDVTAPGIFTRATMLHNCAEPPPAGEERYLAFYESDWSDLARACRVFSDHVGALFRGRQIHAGTVGAHFGIYALREQCLATSRRRHTHSLVAWHLDAPDPAARSAGLGWLRDAVLPAARDSDLFHTIACCELLHGSASFNALRGPAEALAAARDAEPPLLLLLESDLGGAVTLGARLRERLGDAAPPAGATLARSSAFYRAGN